VDQRRAVWSGWGTRDEAEAAVLVALTGDAMHDSPEDVRTVFDLLDVWLADYTARARSPHSSRHRRYCCERMARSSLAAVSLQRIDRRAVERYVADPPRRGSDPIARSTLAEDVTTLRMAWRWGRERGLVPDRELPRVPVEVREDDAVYSRYTPDADEVAAVLAYLERWPWAWRAVYLLWATGCRRSEIANLRWEHVDIPKRQIRIVAGKTGSRTIAIHPQVAATIETWDRVGERVLGVAVSTMGSLNWRIDHACKAIAKPHWSCHGLRRAAVDRLYRGRVEVAVAAKMLGHSVKTAFNHYRRVTADDIAGAVEMSGLGLLPATGDVIDLSERLSRIQKK
jgi:integrase